MIGFFHAILPERSWSSFPAYLAHLASMDPIALRDRMLDAYAKMSCKHDCGEDERQHRAIDWDRVLGDADSYVGFLMERFGEKHVDVDLETTAYRYVIDPPALQELLASHLRWMWDQYLSSEWLRVQSMLLNAVRACQQVDVQGLPFLEAVTRITGQELDQEEWEPKFQGAERLILAPTPHAGPYLSRLRVGKTLWILFGPRLPEGVQIDAPDLSRAEIIMRLGALADDNRLQILKIVSDEGERTSREFMSSLGLSQSATSRHLKQLSATGYLTERRCNGAKCYQLNEQRVRTTLAAVAGYLLGEHQS
jgi:DNA-binding transcriptional ArsR family regulator